MKKTRTILLITLIFAFASLSFADAPGQITLTFDNDTKILTIEAKHDTSNVSKHYVKEIKVKFGGEWIISQKFTKQFDKEKQMAKYLINDAKAGDEIIVEAKCNVFGKKEKKLEVK